MVWVVNGTRRKHDRRPFFELLNGRLGPTFSPFIEEALPKDWLDCSVPVYFDFGDGQLWCLPPKWVVGRPMIPVRRAAFIKAYRNGRCPSSPLRSPSFGLLSLVLSPPQVTIDRDEDLSGHFAQQFDGMAFVAIWFLFPILIALFGAAGTAIVVFSRKTNGSSA
jgi:hypothetical protein